MEQKQSGRRTWLTIRMSDEEHQQAERLRSETTCHSLSDYARKAILGKPVIMRYRNQSLDDFMEGMIALQNELNSIGTNFNQQVRRLHTLRHAADIEQWILVNEQDKTRLFQQIETISSMINKAYLIWSHD